MSRGLAPVAELPPSEGRASVGASIKRMLSDFLDSGAEFAEVTMDSDGSPLTERRISSLRTHMYKVARSEGMEVKTFVRWDEEEGRHRLYLGRKQ